MSFPFVFELTAQIRRPTLGRRVVTLRCRWLCGAAAPKATSEKPATYAGKRRGQLTNVMGVRFTRPPFRDDPSGMLGYEP
jgi:hypothetical protein